MIDPKRIADSIASLESLIDGEQDQLAQSLQDAVEILQTIKKRQDPRIGTDFSLIDAVAFTDKLELIAKLEEKSVRDMLYSLMTAVDNYRCGAGEDGVSSVAVDSIANGITEYNLAWFPEALDDRARFWRIVETALDATPSFRPVYACKA